MLVVNDADEFCKLVGILGLEVVVLVDVALQIIEERLSLADYELPVALTDADDLCPAVAHLPIEELVLTLLARLAQEGRTEGDAVKTSPPPIISAKREALLPP